MDASQKRDELVIQWVVPYAIQALMMVYFQTRNNGAAATPVDWWKIGAYLLATYASTRLFFDISV
jgi:L-cystine uptake protein TcyP (sodium:dicarboxylate symporter family)